jgi:mRNA interferase MazF
MDKDASLLESLLKQAEVFAEQLKANRSRLDTQALNRHLNRHDADKITQALNRIYPSEPSRLDHVWRILQTRGSIGFRGVLPLLRLAYRVLTSGYATDTDVRCADGTSDIGTSATQYDTANPTNSRKAPMVNTVQQGQIWWVDWPESPQRPSMLVVQSDPFNCSQLQTVVGLALDPNWRLAEAPGNVLLSPAHTGLPHACVANVAHLVTIDKGFLNEYVSTLPPFVLESVLDGVQLLFGR